MGCSRIHTRVAATFVAALVAATAASSAGCGGKTFGRVITEVTPAPDDPGLLHVRTCDLVYKKQDPEKVAYGDCKRFGVRRSAIVPVPVTDGAVPPRDDRIITGLRERDGGGAIVTSCRLSAGRDAVFVLADCAELAIPTATIDTQPAPASAAPGSP